MLAKVGGMLAGGALSTGFVCVMDDAIYTQLRMNMILPVKQVISTFTAKQAVDLDEVMKVGQGTANFVSQFKPHALNRSSSKALIMRDEDYATAHDHYFGYINKRQGETL